MSDGVSKSWFCVWNNPQETLNLTEPTEIAEKALEMYIGDSPTRTGAVAYCISALGLHHLHMVLEDVKSMRFSAIKKVFPKMHIEPTKGTKDQAEDYVNKRGKWEEKGEQVVYIARHGEIKGAQGQRKDIDAIEQFINDGKTPNEIFDMYLGYRKYEKMIRDAYYRKREKETPFYREVKVYWHRPSCVTDRTEYGHWELDTVVGNKKKDSGCLMVLTERLTLDEIIMKLEAKKASCVVSAFDDLERAYGTESFKQMFKTITPDNGCEFADWENIERDNRTSVYFAHPYAPHERGSNENQNKFIRRFSPKGKSMADLTQEDATNIQEWMNNYPRKKFGGLSSAEYKRLII